MAYMDYIGFYERHVEALKKEGSDYLGWCPFHPDKGSKRKGFSVNSDNGLWFCFTCNKGGNAITFCKEKGLDVKDAPDYDPQYAVYSYPGGAIKKKARGDSTQVFWAGSGEGRNKSLYNAQAIDQAREQHRTLWICEGEKDTLTMLEAGELAVGIPSASSDKVLEGVSLVEIPEVLVACDHDQAGKAATEKILERFPFALSVTWPEDKPEGFDVTDLWEEDQGGCVEILKSWAVSEDPFKPLDAHLLEKQDREKARDPDELLGYKLEKFPMLGRNVDGIQPGFYVVGAETNAGKTAFLCNLLLDLLDSNDDLTGMYFSLDDHKDLIINRMLGIKSRLPLNTIQKRQASPRHETMLHGAYNELLVLSGEKRLYIRDASEIQGIEDLALEIKRRMNRKLVIVIDGLYNLDVGYEGDILRKENIERANRLKALADTHRIPLICTGELRKRPSGGKQDPVPTIHDLMETGKFAYNANLVLLLYPESWADYDDQDKPILKMKYAKNKVSSYRGTQDLRFHRDTSWMEEA